MLYYFALWPIPKCIFLNTDKDLNRLWFQLPPLKLPAFETYLAHRKKTASARWLLDLVFLLSFDVAISTNQEVAQTLAATQLHDMWLSVSSIAPTPLLGIGWIDF